MKCLERQVELEDALKEAQAFAQEIQDMLLWLNDVDAALSSSKPVGGLPETAKDQLDRFMEVFKELEGTGPKVEALLGRGNDYLKKCQKKRVLEREMLDLIKSDKSSFFMVRDSWNRQS